MSVTTKELLHLAAAKNTAVIGFECIDYNMVYALAEASYESGIPAIAMVDPATCIDKNDCHPTAFAGIYRSVVEQIDAPISLHLDHCYSPAYLLNALKNGFDSVMYDGSNLPIEENAEICKQVVMMSNVFGAMVEAEIGHVGFAHLSDNDNLDLYTKPGDAKAFCEATHVSALAIAIGSAHGMYRSTPKIDIARLREINAATDTPLVLHGGSGIPDEQLEIAFQNGINKFNVGTEYFQVYYQAISEFAEKYKLEESPFKTPLHVLELPKYTQNVMKNYLLKKLQLSKLG